MANLIPQIAKMLGVELGEEFKIEDNTGTLDSIALNSVYAFIEHDSLEGLTLTLSTGEARPLYMPPRPLEPIALKVFELLCRGKCEVIKLPWKPKHNEAYYTFSYAYNPRKWQVAHFSWEGAPIDIALFKAGWVYRTRAEAEAALPAVAAEMGVNYEI